METVEDISLYENSIKEIENLGPEEKKEYYRLVISEILKKNPNGITASQIVDLTGFDHRTVTKHLDFLTAVREAYKKEFGPRTVIYYPNHSLSEPSTKETYQIGDSYYTFSQIQNDFGEFLYIQEKKKDSKNIFTTIGGIIISVDAIDDFISHLQNIKIDLQDGRMQA